MAKKPNQNGNDDPAQQPAEPAGVQAMAEPPTSDIKSASGWLKFLADVINNGKTVAVALIALLCGAAWVAWEIEGKEIAGEFVRETVRADSRMAREMVLDALLELNERSVADRKAALAEIPDQRQIFMVDKNMADLVTSDLGNLVTKIDGLEQRIADHAKQFSTTIDSWQSFELYRYYPSIRNAENNWVPDTSALPVEKVNHDIIAYPKDNLRLFFYAETESAGGFRRIDRQPLVGITVSQEEVRFRDARITGEDVALHCFLRSEGNSGVLATASRLDRPRLIRLGLLLEKVEKDVEFSYKVFVVSKKQPASEEECG